MLIAGNEEPPNIVSLNVNSKRRYIWVVSSAAQNKHLEINKNTYAKIVF